MSALVRKAWAAAIVGMFVVPARLSAAPAVFQPLGDLPGAQFSSIPYAVSADGTTVVGEGTSREIAGDDFGWEAFRYRSSTGMSGLGGLSGWPATTARGVSGDGSVVAGIARYGNYGEKSRAFRWTEESGMEDLGTLGGVPGSRWSMAFGVSADGRTIVGDSSSAQGAQPFRWTEAEGMVGLGQLPGAKSSYARGVSGDGNVIVGLSVNGSYRQPFRWTAAWGMVALSPPGASTFAEAQAVSIDGTTIVGRYRPAEGPEHGFQWTEGNGYQELGVSPGPGGSVNPLCVSADGGLIGGWYGIPIDGDPNGEVITAFVWDAERGVRDLKQVLMGDYGLSEIAEWNLAELDAISADGLTFVGFGTHQDETGGWVSEAFLVRLPEPTSLAFCVLMVALACRRQGRVVGRGRRAG